MATRWSAELSRQFEILYAAGTTMPEAAARLNEMFGVTLTENACRLKAQSMRLTRTRPDSPWAAEIAAEFSTLHATGMSGSLIAKALNEKFGLQLTRSACIARANRTSLPRREIKPREAVAKRLWLGCGGGGNRTNHPRKRGARTVYEDVELKAPEGAGISLMELQSTSCRYPLGVSQRAGTMFCGEPTRDHEGSWCAYHCQFVFRGGRYASAA